MSRVYACAQDHVNFHKYEVVVLNAYITPIPLAVKLGYVCDTAHMQHNPRTPRKTLLPINDMIKIIVGGGDVAVIHDKDVIEIFNIVDMYLREVRHLINNPDVFKYVSHVLKVRPMFYRNFRIVLNKHPEWKKGYEKSSSIPSIVQYALGETGDRKTDNLSAYAEPPYKLDNVPKLKQSEAQAPLHPQGVSGSNGYSIPF
jgi:hypothetical protein